MGHVARAPAFVGATIKGNDELLYRSVGIYYIHPIFITISFCLKLNLKARVVSGRKFKESDRVSSDDIQCFTICLLVINLTLVEENNLLNVYM